MHCIYMYTHANCSEVVKRKKAHLSRDIAARVLTEALTETPCRNGISLHISAPQCQPKTTRIITEPFINSTKHCKSTTVSHSLSVMFFSFSVLSVFVSFTVCLSLLVSVCHCLCVCFSVHLS